jgi:hypothetical protein
MIPSMPERTTQAPAEVQAPLAPGPVVAPAGGGPARMTPQLTVSRVLALQATSGNRAVAAMIARVGEDGGTATADAPAGGVADFMSLITTQQWEAAIRALDAMADAAMVAQLQVIRRVDLEQIKSHADAMGASFTRVRDAAETARVRQLGLDWDEAVRGGRWQEAVTLVQAYNDTDLPLKLEALDYDQIAALCTQADSMLPGYERVRRTAEPIRVRKLNEAYEAAVNGALWPRAVLLVNAYNDTDLLPKCRMISAKGAPALAAAAAAALAQWSDDNNRVRRTLSFLGVEPLTGSAVRPATPDPVTPGTAAPGAAVPELGGTATFSSGGTYNGDPNIYGLGYSGPDAQDTGWIQFIARNIEKFDASGASLGFYTGSWTPSGQGARNFSTTAAPTWFLDTLSNQAPFYEAGGAGLSAMSPTSTVMYDAPAGRNDIVAPVFADPAVKSVKSRAVFDTYLVNKMQVLRHEGVTVEYTYTPALATAGTDPTPVTTHSGGGAVNAMPIDRYRAMTARFPTFAYLPHQ